MIVKCPICSHTMSQIKEAGKDIIYGVRCLSSNEPDEYFFSHAFVCNECGNLQLFGIKPFSSEMQNT